MDDLRDFADDGEQNEEPAVTLGDLRSGEGITVTVDADAETFESDDYGPGIRVPATFHESDYDHRDDDGEAVEEGDDIALVSWSKRLASALVSYDDDHGLVGDTVRITKAGSGFDVVYSVEPAE